MRFDSDITRNPISPRNRVSSRPGLSLLEVLAALAIFLFSVVVISQMVDTGARTAQRSQRMTRAEILCESKIAEIVAGVEPLQNTPPQPLADPEPGWQYSVTVAPEEWTNVPMDNTQTVAGLSTIHVTVSWTPPQGGAGVEYTLSRIILHPQLRVPIPDEPPSNGGGSR